MIVGKNGRFFSFSFHPYGQRLNFHEVHDAETLPSEVRVAKDETSLSEVNTCESN